jgi:1-acyl-sn-glycerol-3-phosphate acyltransferase
MWQQLFRKLYLLWRIVATGYCFAFFGLFGFLIAVTLLPLARLTTRDPAAKNRRARFWVRWIWRFFVWQMKLLGLIQVEVEGQEYLDQSAGKLVIANHPSLIDVVLLISLMPSACCVVKQALWQNPFLKGVVKAMGYISNASAEELLGGSEREFARGGAIVLFPEGSRTEQLSGGLEGQGPSLKFQRGAANIAARCGVDMVPVLIYCDPPTLRKGEPWYRVADRRVRFRLVARPPILLAEALAESGEQVTGSPAKHSRVLTRYLERYFLEGLLKYEHTGTGN